MSLKIKLDTRRVVPFVGEHEIQQMAGAVKVAHDYLHEKSGAGGEFTGWVDHPLTYDREELARLVQVAEGLRSRDALVVIGIGGSYLGARAAIDIFSHYFHSQMPADKRDGPEIYYAGHQMSPTYLAELLEVLDGKDVAINIVSKSGTTTEPALAFRVLRNFLEERFGKEGARERIIATTDRSRGALKQLADEEGYTQFVIPDDIGGRFSVFTPVGLLPIAATGIPVEAMLQGAAAAYQQYQQADVMANDCYRYAAIRNILYRKGFSVEVMVNYEPSMHNFAEWWKQLFGESEGKDGKGIFPAAVDFTTDLHSMGQYLQDGRRMLFETVLNVNRSRKEMRVPELAGNLDGLDYLLGRSLHEINSKAMAGTILAHVDGGVPNLVLDIEEMTPTAFGQMVYFFEKACGISGYLLGVNPFDQPGVEAYKKNVFALLGKEGYAEEQKRLEARLNG